MQPSFCAFWNVENLLDIQDSPRRSEKLQRALNYELQNWTADLLQQKIRQLAAVIMQMNEGRGPDLLGLCEVENQAVLQQLVQAVDLPSRQYKIAHADTADHRGIDVAFLYDSTQFEAGEQFSHCIVKRSATRDLFQVNFQTRAEGKLLVVIGNHWPSRLGGQYESEPYRIIAGETLAYFHQRIQEIHGKNVGVLAMGDFNDDPYNRSLVDYALSEKNRAKVTHARSPRFLNLMWPLLGEQGYSLLSESGGNVRSILDFQGDVNGQGGISD